jgi:hypothetical protein
MIYELVIEDENIDEVFAISLVKSPAMESNFIYFDKEEVRFAEVNDEKRLVMGAILIPDKKVLRVDGEGKPYHVFFKPETIKRLSEMYLENKYTDKSTLEHDGSVKGVNLVESWIVEDRMKDKSAVYGLSLPVGTWMGTFKINNDEIWEDYVKEGKVRGFSIEGLFGHNLVSAAKEEIWMSKDLDELSDDEANLFLSMIKDLLLEAQPSITSTYPGEVASGSIAPALLAEEGCPEATQNIGVNLFNRQTAIRKAKYGPLNPNEPNEEYWKAKADQFGSSVEEAKKALCANCVFFYQTPQILDCIATGIDAKGVDDPYAAIDAGDLGYCEAFDFKCAASRTCDAWVVGGPITQ